MHWSKVVGCWAKPKSTHARATETLGTLGQRIPNCNAQWYLKRRKRQRHLSKSFPSHWHTHTLLCLGITTSESQKNTTVIMIHRPTRLFSVLVALFVTKTRLVQSFHSKSTVLSSSRWVVPSGIPTRTTLIHQESLKSRLYQHDYQCRRFLQSNLISKPTSFPLQPTLTRTTRQSLSSSSSLRSTTDVSSSSDNDADNHNEKSLSAFPESKRTKFRQIGGRLLKDCLLAYALYSFGYYNGSLSIPSSSSSTSSTAELLTKRATARRFVFRSPGTSFILFVWFLREIYGIIPQWIKQRIRFNRIKQRVVGRFMALLGRPSTRDNGDDMDQRMAGIQTNEDPDDLSNVGSLLARFDTLFKLAASKLQEKEQSLQNDETLQDVKKSFDVLSPSIAVFTLYRQLLQRKLYDRTKWFRQAGRSGTLDDLEGLVQAFEYADWAYDESELGSLKENLEREGFTLLRHDKTVIPGYVGHYVAIHKTQRLAVIGIKGSSTFEDMLTDFCGLSVKHQLEEPFVKDGKLEITCHEGILISSRRLANDLYDVVEELLLPCGYKILIVGHSLGAAAASLVAILLKSKIPALRNDTNGDKLKVLAYASPPNLDYENALACRPFITTIVNNADGIPRASLANLEITLEALKGISKKMKEKGGGIGNNTRQASAALIRAFRKDTDGELLMEGADFEQLITDAMSKVEIQDPENLYVAGKTLIMYEKSPNEEDSDETILEEVLQEKLPPTGLTVCDDGTAPVLRFLEATDRTVKDHLSPAYRTSLKALSESLSEAAPAP